MRVLIYGLNYSPELTGIGKYTGEMAEWLSQRGHDVRVVTAPPYYPAWKIGNGYTGSRYTAEITRGIKVLRSPLWVPSQPRTLSRLLHLFSFGFFSLPLLLSQLLWRPQVALCIVPTLFCAPQTILFSKLSGAKSWLHIQDFELDAMLGLGMAKEAGRFSRLAFAIESIVMRSFDRVSTISQGMLRRAVGKGVTPGRTFFFPNWVDTDLVSPKADRAHYRRLWGYGDDDVIALYSGNLGKKQGLESVLQAAKVLPAVKFVIVGEGAHSQELKDAARADGLDNLRFFPLQPYENLPDLLRMADMHLVIQRRGAADAVLPSKLTSILAVGGHAVITADAETELGKLVIENPRIATLVEPENVAALTDAIGVVAATRSNSTIYNLVARRYAEENLSRDAVLCKFESALEALLSR